LNILAAETAHSLLDFPTLLGLNKNCLLRLETSILSSSVTRIDPSGEQASPIKENSLINSHPSAPAPIRKVFTF
jgi:hypothetical protein